MKNESEIVNKLSAKHSFKVSFIWVNESRNGCCCQYKLLSFQLLFLNQHYVVEPFYHKMI